MKNQEKLDPEKLISKTNDEIQKYESEIREKLGGIKCFSKVIEFWGAVTSKISKGKKVVLLLGESKAGKTLLGNYLQGKRPEKYELEPDHEVYYIPSGKDINQGVGDGVSSTTYHMSIIAETKKFIYLDAPGLFDHNKDGDEQKKADRLESIILYWHSLLPLQDKISAILLVIDGTKVTDSEQINGLLQRYGNVLKGVVDYSRVIPVITKISNKDVGGETQESYHLYFSSEEMLDDFKKNEPYTECFYHFVTEDDSYEDIEENFDENLIDNINKLRFNRDLDLKEENEWISEYVKPAYKIGQAMAAEEFKEGLKLDALLQVWKDVAPTKGGELEKKVLDACKELKICKPEVESKENLDIFKDISADISFEDILRLKGKLISQDSVFAECVNPLRKFLLSEERKKMFFHPSSEEFTVELEQEISTLAEGSFDVSKMFNCLFDANKRENDSVYQIFRERIDSMLDNFLNLVKSRRELKDLEYELRLNKSKEEKLSIIKNEYENGKLIEELRKVYYNSQLIELYSNRPEYAFGLSEGDKYILLPRKNPDATYVCYEKPEKDNYSLYEVLMYAKNLLDLYIYSIDERCKENIDSIRFKFLEDEFLRSHSSHDKKYEEVRKYLHHVFKYVEDKLGSILNYKREFSESERLGLENVVPSKRRDKGIIIKLLDDVCVTIKFKGKKDLPVLAEKGKFFAFKDVRDKLNKKIGDIKKELKFKEKNNDDIMVFNVFRHIKQRNIEWVQKKLQLAEIKKSYSLTEAFEIRDKLKDNKIDLGRKFELKRFNLFNLLKDNKIKELELEYKGSFGLGDISNIYEKITESDMKRPTASYENCKSKDLDYFYNYVPLDRPINILESISSIKYFSQEVQSIENIQKSLYKIYTHTETTDEIKVDKLKSHVERDLIKNEYSKNYLYLVHLFSSQDSPFSLDNDFFSRINRTCDNEDKDGLFISEWDKIKRYLRAGVLKIRMNYNEIKFIYDLLSSFYDNCLKGIENVKFEGITAQKVRYIKEATLSFKSLREKLKPDDFWRKLTDFSEQEKQKIEELKIPKHMIKKVFKTSSGDLELGSYIIYSSSYSAMRIEEKKIKLFEYKTNEHPFKNKLKDPEIIISETHSEKGDWRAFLDLTEDSADAKDNDESVMTKKLEECYEWLEGQGELKDRQDKETELKRVFDELLHFAKNCKVSYWTENGHLDILIMDALLRWHNDQKKTNYKLLQIDKDQVYFYSEKIQSKKLLAEEKWDDIRNLDFIGLKPGFNKEYDVTSSESLLLDRIKCLPSISLDICSRSFKGHEAKLFKELGCEKVSSSDQAITVMADMIADSIKETTSNCSEEKASSSCADMGDSYDQTKAHINGTFEIHRMHVDSSGNAQWGMVSKI